MDKEFKKKVDERKVCVGIIGLGYVGLPLVLEFAANGFHTIGFDIDQSKVERLMAGKSYFKHITETYIVSLNEAGIFKPRLIFP